MTSSRYSRRAFLEGIGAGAALLPLLHAGRASAAPFPKRLLIVLQTSGTVADQFWPKGTGTDLADLTMPAVVAPLVPHRKDLIFVDGIAMRNFTDYPGHGAGHENHACTFTGVMGYEGYRDENGPRFLGGGPSIDQAVADGIAAQTKLPMRSLHLASQVSGNLEFFARCFYRGKQQPVTPELDPGKALGALMGAGIGGAPAAPMPDMDRLRAERKSILDFVGRDVTAFGKRVGVEDRVKIEGYLQSLRDLEQRLGGGAPGGATAGCAPPKLGAFDPRARSSYPQVVAAHLDLAVAALACDVTRVATVQLTDANGNHVVFDWLKDLTSKNVTFNPGGVRNYHDIAHHPGEGGAEKVKADRWYMEQFAALLARMKSVKEGDGTLLDNTVVLWANHMGNGGAHSSDRLPWILAGSAGGYLKTGRYVKGTGRVPTNQVLVALANAVGVPMQTFGDPQYGGEMPGLRG